MKLSVSLPEADVEFLDAYAKTHGVESRSAVLQQALRLLRSGGLAGAYAQAWQEWDASGAAEIWDGAAGDGLGR